MFSCLYIYTTSVSSERNSFSELKNTTSIFLIILPQEISHFAHSFLVLLYTLVLPFEIILQTPGLITCSNCFQEIWVLVHHIEVTIRVKPKLHLFWYQSVGYQSGEKLTFTQIPCHYKLSCIMVNDYFLCYHSDCHTMILGHKFFHFLYNIWSAHS